MQSRNASLLMMHLYMRKAQDTRPLKSEACTMQKCTGEEPSQERIPHMIIRIVTS